MGDRLKDRVAIVTGSGRGIGRGIALAMAAEGAKVVVNDYGVKVDGTEPASGPADEVVAEIKKAGGIAVANYDTVATVPGGENIIKTAIDNFGRLDILVNNAGILRDRMVFNMSEEEWDAVIATHCKGHFCCSKPACVLFRQQRSGVIVNFSSTSGVVGNTGQANYGAAKDGIAGFTRVLARDMGRYGVRVNAIVPGAATRMTATVPTAARDIRAAAGIGTAAAPARAPTPAPAAAPRMVPNPPEAIAPMVVWLATDAAANVNGYLFGVSGGTIQLYSHPEPIKRIQKLGIWEQDELAAAIRTLTMDLVNPAPPRPPTPPSA